MLCLPGILSNSAVVMCGIGGRRANQRSTFLIGVLKQLERKSASTYGASGKSWSSAHASRKPDCWCGREFGERWEYFCPECERPSKFARRISLFHSRSICS